ASRHQDRHREGGVRPGRGEEPSPGRGPPGHPGRGRGGGLRGRRPLDLRVRAADRARGRHGEHLERRALRSAPRRGTGGAADGSLHDRRLPRGLSMSARLDVPRRERGPEVRGHVTMAESPTDAQRNRTAWTGFAPQYAEWAPKHWAATEITWGMWHAPEAE